MKKLSGLTTSLILAFSILSACDSPSALIAERKDQPTLQIRANFQAASSSLQAATLTILEVDKLPEALKNASLLEIVFDTTKARIPITRNSDGTLTFPYRSSRPISGEGELPVLIVGDRRFSYSILLETGPELELATPAIEVQPAMNITQGTRLRLKANFKDPSKIPDYDFFWSAATASAGPWQSISGNSDTISWDSAKIGNYFIHLEMRHKKNQSTSSYTSPTALVRVLDSDHLALTEPTSGVILEGEKIKLKANLPELENLPNLRYLWSYSVSTQASFSPIVEEGAQITWEPPRAGSYFLRLQVLSDQGNSTYTSSKALVQVSPADSVIETLPASGSLIRGESVNLSAKLVDSPELSYTWFYGFSPQASFTPIPGSGKNISWTPNLTGDFYLRLRTFNTKTNQSVSYTSSKSLVSVRDSDAVFTTDPSPASLLKGSSVNISLNDSSSENIIWSYASTSQGPFLPIPATGKKILWTPPASGSFYLRAEAPRADGSLATFVSANSLVTVSDRSDAIQTEPQLANLQLGQAVTLRSSIQVANGSYAWSYATNASGPFTPLPSLESQALSTVTWYPTQSGSYYIKLDISDPGSKSAVSFISEQPLVQILEKQPFFSLDPSSGRIKTTEHVTIKAQFDTRGRAFNYGWAYGKSAAGPFTPMGGSALPEIFWNLSNKPAGSYYLRFTATPPGSDRTLTYISSTPLLFVSSSDASAPEFGISSLK
ncbi:hypothetical protein COW36_22700 [bacterium (Candidatus Blackallbacteria) CG17_big_fil_post_rev_8_21_14_2_50_48_46]|uniref:PKD domain-containing protein n=1 Tax=bacterium (Candidatus Blackallbacteria) CG17_big_fil_post_rev_8_21_14_2_50_48_46 TaxID=2014261 RepID=A0A2M7FY92_9BACT|nr:MAG: hypothetical protein COW64_07470 [bacterium (Candidatus Blackallbacteria) CG18_big_fil_WC_8_21_14_2_50_49_26]PIW14189.1 MAG: hypothetical protein COW36_22700 [bacterium (Candidatus Blackallbacteria) CG17_big_fil_post_rev_8_21_14_2_50_48_46]PIW46730.1 MAG: hypothetical protein COW20_14975 [bacterium (Candidatus Blackallbacteria) CG13_big_fil_rev_8_21_14_2_50_49_14]